MPRKREKRQEKRKKMGEKKRKVKVETVVLLLNPSRARTSQADILHLDQKAVKCTTCKRLCGRFELFIAQQWPENRSTSFKTLFFGKISRGEWVKVLKQIVAHPKDEKKFLTRQNCPTLPQPPSQKWSTLMHCYVFFFFFLTCSRSFIPFMGITQS